MRTAQTPRWGLLAVAALVTVGIVGVLVYPTYPNYDSYYSLLWGRELLHGTSPSFEAYRAPTEHPLAIAFGALLALFGQGADRLMVGATVLSFVALAAGLYRLAAVSFTRLVGVVAVLLLCTRFDFPFLALRAYVDIPYVALVLWAAVLEAERPRRGQPVFLLLAAAGLLRPEAWLLSGAYFLWMAVPASWPERVRFAALTAIGPVVWTLVDTAVTGNPLFSLRHTSGLAEELGRQESTGLLPQTIFEILRSLDKTPVLLAAVPGFVAAVLLRRRRGTVPLALLVLGLVTFVLLIAGGASVVQRYLTVPALVIMIYAGVGVAGWTLLPPGDRVRQGWAAIAGLLVVYAALFTVTHVTPSKFTDELQFRQDYHQSLSTLLHDPAVRAARRCGPVSLPNHKLIPEVRWILGAGAGDVVARSDRHERRRVRRGGVAIYARAGKAFLRYGYKPDGIRVALPLPGYRTAAQTAMFRADVRC
ncbi:MAG TPA: hypothetical protein VFT50_02870 [Baekduia sp.]|nr:hypothetical protein [Baekduia sp.]